MNAPGESDAGEGGRLRFGPAQRLRRPAEFQQAFKQGFRLSNAHYTANIRPNGSGAPRLGLAIAARVIGNAVARNRLRRLIREQFRLRQYQLPAVDLVVGARPEARTAARAALRASLDELFARVERRCAR